MKSVTDDGIRLVVDRIEKNRVETVHVYLPEQTANEEEEDKDSGKKKKAGSSAEAESDKVVSSAEA